jgi:hypothetical protein
MIRFSFGRMNENEMKSEEVVLTGKGFKRTNCVLSESFAIVFQKESSTLDIRS